MDTSAVIDEGPVLTQVLFEVPPILIWLAGIGWFAIVGLLSYIWVEQKNRVSLAYAKLEQQEKEMAARFERIENRMQVAIETLSNKLTQTREDYVSRTELQRYFQQMIEGQARVENIVSALAKSFRHERLQTAQRLVILEAKAGIESRELSGREPGTEEP